MFVCFVSLSLSTMEEDTEMYKRMPPGATFKRNDVLPPKQAKALLVRVDDKESDRAPINIQVRYDLYSKKGCYCKNVGDVINWSEAINYECTQNDILTPVKEKALRDTLSNLQMYFKGMLNVRHTDVTDTVPGISSSSDHLITISTATFATTTLGFSQLKQYHKKTLRPVGSAITFSVAYLPTEAQNYDTKERFFFNLCVHEVMHSLGLVDFLYPHYIDKSTGMPYEKAKVTFKRSGINKNYHALCTPKAVEVAQRRFGRTTDKFGNKLCLEIEDLGGLGTVFAHPKATIYRQDLMAGIASHDSVLSEVVLSILEDMGWYTVNWSMAEPMTWGAKELLTEEELGNFTEKPAWKSIPKSYLCDNTKYATGHDFKSHGQCSGFDYDINQDILKLRQYLNLYIPSNYFISRNSPFDYLPIKNFENICGEGKWAFVNAEATSSICLSGRFDSDSFIVEYQGEEYECASEGDLINNTWVCPDPKQIKKIDDFLNTKPHDYGHVELYGETHMQNEEVIKVIIIAGAVIALIIAIFIVICCCCIKQKQPDDVIGDIETDSTSWSI